MQAEGTPETDTPTRRKLGSPPEGIRAHGRLAPSWREMCGHGKCKARPRTPGHQGGTGGAEVQPQPAAPQLSLPLQEPPQVCVVLNTCSQPATRLSRSHWGRLGRDAGGYSWEHSWRGWHLASIGLRGGPG